MAHALPSQLAARLAARERVRPLTESLADFVPRVSPWLKAPLHLAPLLEVFEEAARVGSVRAVTSTPPQHGKTVAVSHALTWMLRRTPSKRNAYVTYEADRAEDVNLQIQNIAREAGLGVDGNRKLWRTPAGGSVLATGVGGPLTGYPIDGWLVIDDPLKNRAEAESSTIRNRAWDWLTSTALTRCHPGASVLVIQTRWHVDDPAGRLIDKGWRRVNLPAIDNHGRALWEEARPAKWLLEEVKPQVGEYDWAALYQGEPRTKGGALFRDVAFYETLPDRYRVAIGVDLAYTSKKHADYSAAVVLAKGGDGRYYVLDVVRAQEESPRFFDRLLILQQRYPGARFVWHTSTTEKGLAEMMNARGLNIWAEPAASAGDKFTRAQPVAAAWNTQPEGRVMVPRSGHWVSDFVAELANFTGVNDRHDDQVDALASAFNDLAVAGPSGRAASVVVADPDAAGAGW